MITKGRVQTDRNNVKKVDTEWAWLPYLCAAATTSVGGWQQYDAVTTSTQRYATKLSMRLAYFAEFAMSVRQKV